MFNRYKGTTWDQRFLPRLTHRQVADMPKENTLIVLSIGAVEQHGYHLPLMTDSLTGEGFLAGALEKLNPETSVWVIPPLSYGKSNEHTGFPGTISLSSITLQHVITDIAKSLYASGFRKLLLLNTHGGNMDLLNLISREIRLQTEMTIFYVSPFSLADVSDLITPEEHQYGIHAGDNETSVIQHIKPEWVQQEYAVREIPNMKDYEYLTLEDTVRFAWKTADITTSGVIGDATVATPEKGKIMFERITDALAQAITELCTFEVANVKTSTQPSTISS